jgi:hypothetical protein
VLLKGTESPARIQIFGQKLIVLLKLALKEVYSTPFQGVIPGIKKLIAW